MNNKLSAIVPLVLIALAAWFWFGWRIEPENNASIALPKPEKKLLLVVDC